MDATVGLWAHRMMETDWSPHNLTAPWFWSLRRSSSSLSFGSAEKIQKDKKRDTVADANHLDH